MVVQTIVPSVTVKPAAQTQDFGFMPAGQALADTHTPFEIDHQYTGKDTPQPRLLLRKSSHRYAHLAHAAHLQHHKIVS